MTSVRSAVDVSCLVPETSLALDSTQWPGGRASYLACDPRTTIAATVIVNSSVLGDTPYSCTLVGAVVTLCVLPSVSTWRPVFAWAAACGLLIGGYIVAPGLSWGWGSLLLAGLGHWGSRFAVVIGFAWYAIAAITPGQLSAALAAWRCPRIIQVPLLVLLRFFPAVIDDVRAILESLRLRGESSGMGSLRHPVQFVERAIVPLLAGISRASDDLAASAMVRGLDSPIRATSATAVGFGLRDCALLLIVGCVPAAAALGMS